MKTKIWISMSTPCYATAERSWVIFPFSKWSFSFPKYFPNEIMLSVEKFIEKYDFVEIGY